MFYFKLSAVSKHNNSSLIQMLTYIKHQRGQLKQKSHKSLNPGPKVSLGPRLKGCSLISPPSWPCNSCFILLAENWIPASVISSLFNEKILFQRMFLEYGWARSKKMTKVLLGPKRKGQERNKGGAAVSKGTGQASGREL